MPPLPKRPPRASEFAELDLLSEMRDRTVRAVKLTQSRILADATIHRRVTNFLLTLYLTCSQPEEVLAVAYLRAIRHLLEGGPLQECPLPYINAHYARTQIAKLLRGELVSLDTENGNEGETDD